MLYNYRMLGCINIKITVLCVYACLCLCVCVGGGGEGGGELNGKGHHGQKSLKESIHTRARFR